MNITKRVAVTPSKYALWRCAISLAHCDGYLSNSEVNLIHEHSENFDFTNEQLKQLEIDFRHALPPEELFLQITDKLDRAHLLNFARVLFHIDGEFSAVEEKMLELLHSEHMKTVDLRGAMRDASAAAKQFYVEENLREEVERSREGWVLRAFRYLGNIGE